MWHCSNCKAEVADKYSFCWQCGKKRVPQPQPAARIQEPAVPAFASYEELAPEPPSHGWIFRRGLTGRFFGILVMLVFLGILKVLSSRFFGTYGIYIFVAVAVIALLLILWRFFRRDVSEGVGLKLH